MTEHEILESTSTHLLVRINRDKDKLPSVLCVCTQGGPSDCSTYYADTDAGMRSAREKLAGKVRIKIDRTDNLADNNPETINSRNAKKQRARQKKERLAQEAA